MELQELIKHERCKTDLFYNGLKCTYFELLVKTFYQTNYKISERQLLKLVLGVIF